MYGLDLEFDPFFVKFSSYFPYGAKLCFNGHHWAQRQTEAAGIAFTALDNGFLECDHPDALQRLCERLSSAKVDTFFRRWLARLPHPFTGADRRAGYRYELSILQAEFSLTQVLDRPQSGRVFFEQLIRENLDLGRPDKASLIFDRRVRLRGRRPTPSRFRSRVITADVTPSIHVDYKHSKIKQYHKLQRAIRTETTINDTRDFGIGKRLRNLPHSGRSASKPTGDCSPPNGSATTRSPPPSCSTRSPTQSPSLRVARGSPGCASVTLARWRCAHYWPRSACPCGVSPTATCARISHLCWDCLPGTMTAGQATYDLRRLRTHGLIERIPHTNRYLPTEDGLRAAIVLTQTHARLLTPALASATNPAADFPRLHRALANVRPFSNEYAERQGLAA